MQDINLFLIFSDILNYKDIEYFVTGAVATIVYGESRLTHDIDLVIHLSKNQVYKFIKAFPQKIFYCPPEEVIVTEMNRPTRAHFNIIHHETGF